jgi:hypothetical protein
MLGKDVSRNKCFSSFEYHVLYALYPFVTYLLTLPGKCPSSVHLGYPVAFRLVRHDFTEVVYVDIDKC